MYVYIYTHIYDPDVYMIQILREFRDFWLNLRRNLPNTTEIESNSFEIIREFWFSKIQRYECTNMY